MIRTAYRDRVLAGIAAALGGHSPLRHIIRYHVGLEDESGGAFDGAGKLLRASLVLFFGEQFDASRNACLQAATALELVHNFSLIHDDIQDRDETRRGRPTVWVLHGVAEAINAGDLLHAIADQQACRAGPEVARWVTNATMDMIEGQSRDLAFEQRLVNLEEYLGMVDRKTGALLRCAFVLGAVVAGAGEATLEALNAAGAATGRAFQIRDDLLGVWGDGATFGKPVGSDIRRRKKAYPIAMAFSEAGTEDRNRLMEIYEREGVSDDDVDWVVGLMERMDIPGIGDRAVRRHVQDARTALEGLPLTSDGRNAINDLLDYLTRRNA